MVVSGYVRRFLTFAVFAIVLVCVVTTGLFDGMIEICKNTRSSISKALRLQFLVKSSCVVGRSGLVPEIYKSSPLARCAKIGDPLEPLARSRTFPDNPSESQARRPCPRHHANPAATTAVARLAPTVALSHSHVADKHTTAFALSD
jgi:hypothetical protein